MNSPDTDQTPDPTPYAIFTNNGPLNPSFVREATRALFRTLPLDRDEPRGFANRRMHAALLALSALNPRDEIELMLGVQALSAYHAAAAAFYIGMNHHRPNGDSTRHITAACSAARTFDSLLKAIERRQAKLLATPRPASQSWDDAPDPTAMIDALTQANIADQHPPSPPRDPNEPPIVWSQEDIAHAEAFMEKRRIDKENEGLDIANTEGILPGGGMILMENPTPQQIAYMGRRLGLMYRREYAENLRKGIKKMPEIRGIRPGDLIP